MIRVKFDNDALGKQRYEVCTQAVLLSNPQHGGKSIAVSEWDDVVTLVRALKGIGESLGKLPNGIELFELAASGGEMELGKGERNLLVSFLKQPMWRPDVIENVQEAIVWLDSLKSETPLKKVQDA